MRGEGRGERGEGRGERKEQSPSVLDDDEGEDDFEEHKCPGD